MGTRIHTMNHQHSTQLGHALSTLTYSIGLLVGFTLRLSNFIGCYYPYKVLACIIWILFLTIHLYLTITFFTSITVVRGTESIVQNILIFVFIMRILCITFSNPQNTFMDLNNGMTWRAVMCGFKDVHHESSTIDLVRPCLVTNQ